MVHHGTQHQRVALNPKSSSQGYSMTDEKRKNVRIPAQITVVMKNTTFDGTLCFTASNLSSSGMFLEADTLLTKGAIVSVEYSLPGSKTHVRAVAQVTRIAEKSTRDTLSGMGLEFLEMNLASREELHRFLDEQTQKLK